MPRPSPHLLDLRLALLQASSIPYEKRMAFHKAVAGFPLSKANFLGVTVPALRCLMKNYLHLSDNDLATLLASFYHEEKLFALLLLVHRYQKGDAALRHHCHYFYVKHLKKVNHWDLVDSSAPGLIGQHLLASNKDLLLQLVSSKNLWERRIAIVATWTFIRQEKLQWTFRLAKQLLQDKEDLIHKAVGWMLREAGKKDQKALLLFLQRHGSTMARTMLRYAIEKLSIEQKASLMALGRK